MPIAISPLTRPAGSGSALPVMLFLAVFVPCALAVEYGPVIGQLQEQLSYGLWALSMAALAWQRRTVEIRLHRSALLLVALCVALSVVALVQCTIVLRVPHRGLLSFFYLMAVAALLLSGALAATLSCSFVRPVFTGLLAAGLLNAGIAAVQVFGPSLADDVWIAQGFATGRANGNLRQPNQLAVLLVIAVVALWALQSTWSAARRTTAIALCLTAPLLLGIALSASRFGLACILLIIAHGVISPSAPRLRVLALGSMLMLIGLWVASSALASLGGSGLVIADRLMHETASGSRWPLWHASLHLLNSHPWLGVGWGEFNRAWMLTPKVLATPHSFSNAHNLPLHWAVELGIPAALLGSVIVLYCLWTVWRRAASAKADKTVCTAIALISTVLLLYSLVEFPFWYARWLFPLCFLVGLVSYQCAGICIRLPAWKTLTAGLLLALLAAHIDYRRTSGLQDVRGLNPQQVEDRAALARRSFLYSSMAFRATALSMRNDALATAAVLYAGEDYLDIRLMVVWAEALDAAGDHARAQFLLDRVAEMGGSASNGGCRLDPAGAVQCHATAQELDTTDFR